MTMMFYQRGAENVAAQTRSFQYDHDGDGLRRVALHAYIVRRVKYNTITYGSDGSRQACKRRGGFYRCLQGATEVVYVHMHRNSKS